MNSQKAKAHIEGVHRCVLIRIDKKIVKIIDFFKIINCDKIFAIMCRLYLPKVYTTALS